ncbi:hypothetical protein EV715DRAFT_291420 [Schizophyllum commune]
MEPPPISPDNLFDNHIELFNTLVFFAVSLGIHLTLYIASVTALTRRPSKGKLLYAVTTFLFLDSTAWVALNFCLAISVARLPIDPGSINAFQRIGVLLLTVPRLNSILSDAVVVWRAWILWPNNKTVKGILVFCIFSTTAGHIGEFAYSYSKYGAFAYASHLPELRDNWIRAFLFMFPTAMTNIIVTALVAIKVREYRRDIKRNLGQATKTRLEKFLVLLVESGCVYSAIWIAFFAIDTSLWSRMLPSSDVPGFGPWDIIGAFMPATAGIYPTIVIIISTLQASPTTYIQTADIGLSIGSMKSDTLSSDAERQDLSNHASGLRLPDSRTYGAPSLELNLAD